MTGQSCSRAATLRPKVAQSKFSLELPRRDRCGVVNDQRPAGNHRLSDAKERAYDQRAESEPGHDCSAVIAA